MSKLNGPELPGAVNLKLSCHCSIVQHGVSTILCLGWRDISDGLKPLSGVEPVDPFKRGTFDGFKGSPWASAMNNFGLVETIDRFGQSLVIAITDAADRRFDPSIGHTPCEID